MTGPGPTFLGVDLGGTGTRIVRTDARGQVLARRSVVTTEDPSRVPGDLAAELGRLVDPSTTLGIGLGVSGPVDTEGVIRNPATLPAYTGVDLRALLGSALTLPVVVENDALTAARGEALAGAGRGAASVLMVTLGTGVGVALLDHGTPHRTRAGTHPEAGHRSVAAGAPCYCGRSACWEQVASRAALERASHDLGLSLDEAADAAEAGDRAAAALFEQYGRAVADGIADLLTLFGPARVVLGGGGSRYLASYAGYLSERLDTIHGCYDPTPVVAGELGDLAGAVGAALLVSDHLALTAAAGRPRQAREG